MKRGPNVGIHRGFSKKGYNLFFRKHFKITYKIGIYPSRWWVTVIFELRKSSS